MRITFKSVVRCCSPSIHISSDKKQFNIRPWAIYNAILYKKCTFCKLIQDLYRSVSLHAPNSMIQWNVCIDHKSFHQIVLIVRANNSLLATIFDMIAVKDFSQHNWNKNLNDGKDYDVYRKVYEEAFYSEIDYIR